MSTPESDPAARLTLPRRTTPTWEVELLLSGATVFALVQLATWLPGWAGHISPRLSDFWRQVADMSLVYLMCGVVVLTVAFVLHLLLLETSCFRYWGQGVWTEYAREIHRRGLAHRQA